MHLQDAHYKGSAKLGHGIGYKYAHDYPITVGLTTIWGAGGALAALILNILDVPFAGQVVAFFL